MYYVRCAERFPMKPGNKGKKKLGMEIPGRRINPGSRVFRTTGGQLKLHVSIVDLKAVCPSFIFW